MSPSPKYSLLEIERRWLAIFDVEFDSEAAAHAFRPPSFVTREITSDPAFTGLAIAAAHGIDLG